MIVAFPHAPGGGGPGSFQYRFQEELDKRGWQTTYFANKNLEPDVVMVVGGTRKILRLLLHKLSGVPIVYRLDGIPWLHRKRWPGLKSFFIKELHYLLLQVTHAFLADYVVYQSVFVREWWERCGWRQPENTTVIYNGVDLTQFDVSDKTDPIDSQQVGRDLICVEGHLDYSPYAIDLINQLAVLLRKNKGVIRLYGDFDDSESQMHLSKSVDYRGVLSRDEMHNAYKNGIYLSLDVNAACPNTVIEAMSCGIPVVGFRSGAIAELVSDSCGCIVSYGGDPWALDFPDVESLHQAIEEILANYTAYSRNARKHAEKNFNVEEMTTRYLEIIDKAIGQKSEVR